MGPGDSHFENLKLDGIIWQAQDLRWYFESLNHTLPILNSKLL